MGGSSYDRDVYEESSSSSWGSSYGSSFGTSSESAKKFTSATLHSSMNPKGKILKSNSKSPSEAFTAVLKLDNDDD